MNLNIEDIKIPRGTDIKISAPETLSIIKKRKSRIIMKDGEKLLSLASDLKAKNPGYRIIFRTDAPVCSKTEKYLNENGIEVYGIA